MSCLRWIASVTLVLCAGSAGAAPREVVGTVSIRINDYSNVNEDHLEEAQRQVAATYARIGVALDWQPLIRPETLAPEAWPTLMTDITIVLLTDHMAARLPVGAEVAGYAAVERNRGGRVAYVLAERTAGIASEAGVEQAEVLTDVMAHELAHLLMPEPSHSSGGGVMRANWNPSQFRDVSRREFSPAEAASIRQMVRGLRGKSARTAD